MEYDREMEDGVTDRPETRTYVRADGTTFTEPRLTQAEWLASFERWRQKHGAYTFERELRRDPDSVDG